VTKRILITGASGFIGRQSVIPLLEIGYEVHLATRRPSSPDVLETGTQERCRVHEVDLLDARSTARCVHDIRPSHVLHFAWHSELETRWSSPANLAWAAATLNLATAFAAAGGRRMVVCGSCAEYDWGFETLTEDRTPLAPATLYGAAKAGTHELLRLAAPHLNLSLAWGHVFFCYGPGEPTGRLISDVVTGLLAGRPVACTAGHQIRDYMHSEDIGRAFASLVESDFSGAVNIASGVGIRLRDLIGTTAELIGRPDLIQFGARPQKPGEPACLVADVRRLRQEIGYCPTYDLETGLAQTIEWYRQHID
jgi:nucleoside-diphosphate-sugar epimerase